MTHDSVVPSVTFEIPSRIKSLQQIIPELNPSTCSKCNLVRFNFVKEAFSYSPAI